MTLQEEDIKEVRKRPRRLHLEDGPDLSTADGGSDVDIRKVMKVLTKILTSNRLIVREIKIE